MVALSIAGVGLPGLVDAGSAIFDGGGDQEAAAAADRDAFACDGSADPVQAARAAALAERSSEARRLLNRVVDQVNFADSRPSTLQEKACYWSHIVQMGWPSPGDPPASARDELLQLVEQSQAGDGASVTAGGGGGTTTTGTGDDRSVLEELFDTIVRPGLETIERRAEGAAQGAAAGARAGAQRDSFLQGALPWALAGGVVLLVLLARS